MTKIISFSNHKGGVGKTTSALNIGAGLNLQKKKVLLVDLDPQANLSLSLGVVKAENNIYGALCEDYEIKPVSIMKGLDLIPATIDLAKVETEFIGLPAREYFLKEIIDRIKHQYDYVLIDCPPSLGILTTNAFTASDEVLIPLESQFLAMQGLTELIGIIKKNTKRINPSLIIGGVFLTKYNGRLTLSKEIFNFAKQNFPNEIFNTKIRQNTTLAEAPSTQLDILRYAPNSNGANDYKELAKEIIKRHKQNEKNRTNHNTQKSIQ
jgi:chromosome partitioning protein